MELDDLKKSWKSTITGNQSTDAIKEAIEKKIPTLERSGKGIARTFWIEMSITWAIYVVFWIIIWQFKELLPAYMYKIVILIGVAMLPIVWRLYKSQQWISSLDYSQDVRSNVVAFVRYYRTTLRIYEWGTYVIILLTLILLYTDQSFLAESKRMQLGLAVYVIVVSLLARPYIHLLYGKKVTVFEDFLKD